ncbi:hypothetical protein [Flavobacterium psychraquaticum]|uniref:hypothetical protein n=1 Tax=Flavobacterium psychraquaticum TaxID=3103958 RepID=UPI002ACD39BB|nr:hypothetical protein [Flavobacterium sp. LB-N7T]
MSKKEIKKIAEPSEIYEVTQNNEATSEVLHPVLIQLLEQSIQEAEEGKFISHEEVMRMMKEKYPFLK